MNDFSLPLPALNYCNMSLAFLKKNKLRIVCLMFTFGVLVWNNSNAQFGRLGDKIKDIKGKVTDTKGKVDDTKGRVDDTKNKVDDTKGKANDVKGKGEGSGLTKRKGTLSDEDYKKWLIEMGKQFNPILGDLTKGELPDLYDTSWNYFNNNFNYTEVRAIIEREGEDPFGGIDYYGSRFHKYMNGEFAESFKANYTKLAEAIAAEADKAFAEFNNITHYSNTRVRHAKTLDLLKGLYDVLIAGGLVDGKTDKNYEYVVGNVYNQTAAPYYDKVYLDSFHRINAGKILFSAEPINPKKLKPEQFKTKFDLKTDHIYGIVLADAWLIDVAGMPQSKNDMGMIRINMETSGKGISSYIIIEQAKKYGLLREQGYYLLDIYPDTKNAFNEKITREMGKDFLSKLPPREVPVTISYNPGTIAYIGELKITGGNAATIQAESEAGAKAAQVNASKFVELDKAFYQPMKACKDAELSADKISKAFAQSESNVKRVVAVRFLEGNCSWYVTTYPLGMPKYRDAGLACAAVYETTDGKFWYKEFQLGQYYIAGKGYGALRAMFGSNPILVASEKVKGLKQ